MDRKELDELKEVLEGMYAGSPEVENLHGLVRAFSEAGEDAPEEADLFKACEELVAEGILQKAGRDGYEATEAFMIEHGHGEDR